MRVCVEGCVWLGRHIDRVVRVVFDVLQGP